MVKKIAILTSGGDCAGLNAVIRAVTLRAHNKYNWEVYGIKDGTFYPIGGFHEIIKGMKNICDQKGVKFLKNEEVTKQRLYY